MQALSSSSSGDQGPSKQRDNTSAKGATSVVMHTSSMLSGAKRPRSPKVGTCGHCFRTTHKTSECWHQVVCLRCAGVGHVVAKCSIDPHRSPLKEKLHVR